MEGVSLVFDKNGYLLPYDVVPINWEILVKTFAGNEHRQRLLADYNSYLKTLHSVLPVVHRQWVDGSFISKQEQPGDIDVIIFVPHTHFNQITSQLKQLKNQYIGRIDFYFVETFPSDHPKYEIGRADELTWYYFLRTDRRKRPKGILELQVDYGNQ